MPNLPSPSLQALHPLARRPARGPQRANTLDARPGGPTPEAGAARLLAALDAHAIVSIADVHGRIVHVNQRFCDVSGYRADELLGDDHRRLKSGLHPPGFYESMWRQLAQGQIWQGELCNRHKSGALYWVAATIVPLIGGDGLPQRYVSLRTDITAVRQASDARPEPEDALARLDHALRTPLNTILGYTQTLRSDPTLAAAHAAPVQEIHAAGLRMLGLLDGRPRRQRAIAPLGRTPTTRAAQTAHVLCIEDDIANLKLVQSMLGLLPHVHASGASNGRDGLSLAQQRTPDVVLLDIHLPDTTGPALLQQLRELPGLQGTAIVAVSADAQPTQIAQALAAGFDDYIVKPFDMQLLLDRVQSHLARRNT